MNNKDKFEEEVEEASEHVLGDVPFEGQLKEMSGFKLNKNYCESKEGSNKRMAFADEIEKRKIAKQEKNSRINIIIAGFIGGFFAIAGTIIGSYLNCN